MKVKCFLPHTWFFLILSTNTVKLEMHSVVEYIKKMLVLCYARLDYYLLTKLKKMICCWSCYCNSFFFLFLCCLYYTVLSHFPGLVVLCLQWRLIIFFLFYYIFLILFFFLHVYFCRFLGRLSTQEVVDLILFFSYQALEELCIMFHILLALWLNLWFIGFSFAFLCSFVVNFFG